MVNSVKCWMMKGIVVIMMVMIVIHHTSADSSSLIKLTVRSARDRSARAALEPPTVTSLRPSDRNKSGRGVVGISVQSEQSGSHIPPVVASRSPSSSSNSKDYSSRYLHMNPRFNQPLAPVATASSGSRTDYQGGITGRSLSGTHLSVPAPTPHLVNGTSVTTLQKSSWVPPVSYAPPPPRNSYGSSGYAPVSRGYPRGVMPVPSYVNSMPREYSPPINRGVWGESRRKPSYPQGNHRVYGHTITEDDLRSDTFGLRISEDLSHLGSEFSSRRSNSRRDEVLSPRQNAEVYSPSRGNHPRRDNVRITNHNYQPQNGNYDPNGRTDDFRGPRTSASHPFRGGERESPFRRYGSVPESSGSNSRFDQTHVSQPRPSEGTVEEVDGSQGRKKNRRKGKNKKRGRKNGNKRKRGRKDKKQKIPDFVYTTIILPVDITKNESMSQLTPPEPTATLSPVSSTTLFTVPDNIPSGQIPQEEQSNSTVLLHSTNPSPEPELLTDTPIHSQAPTLIFSHEATTTERTQNFTAPNYVPELEITTSIQPNFSQSAVSTHPALTSWQQSITLPHTTPVPLTTQTTIQPILVPTTTTQAIPTTTTRGISTSSGDASSPTINPPETDIETDTTPLPQPKVPKASSLTLPPTTKSSEVSIISFTVMEVPMQVDQAETLPEDITPIRRQNHRKPHKRGHNSHPKRIYSPPKLLPAMTPKKMDDGMVIRTPFVREENKNSYTFPVKGFMIITGIMGALAVFTLVVLISYAIIKCSKQPVVNNYQVSEQKPATQ